MFDNLDNVDFVDELIDSIMKTDDNAMINEFNNQQEVQQKEDSYDSEDEDESIQFTIKKEAQDTVADLEF